MSSYMAMLKSFYSLQHQNWRCSEFFPELSLYQAFPQETVSQQHDNLLALSSLPSSAPKPKIFPFIRSMFQPDHGHYFPEYSQEPVALISGIGPFLYLSNHVMTFPVRSVSKVTISEIEENPQMEEEWFKGDGDLDCWKNNCSSNVSRPSFNNHSEQRIQERLQEKDEEKSSGFVANAGNSIQLQRKQLEQDDWISPGLMDARYRPRAINTVWAKFQLQNPDHLDHLLSDIGPGTPILSSSGSGRGFVPASFATHVTIRASATASTGSLRLKSSNRPLHTPPPTKLAASGCSARPWPEGTKNHREVFLQVISWHQQFISDPL